MGRPSKEGVKLAQITVRFKEEDMERVKAMAEAETRPPANFITWVVLKYLKEAEDS